MKMGAGRAPGRPHRRDLFTLLDKITPAHRCSVRVRVNRTVMPGVLQDDDPPVGSKPTTVDYFPRLGRPNHRATRSGQVDAFVGNNGYSTGDHTIKHQAPRRLNQGDLLWI